MYSQLQQSHILQCMALQEGALLTFGSNLEFTGGDIGVGGNPSCSCVDCDCVHSRTEFTVASTGHTWGDSRKDGHNTLYAVYTYTRVHTAGLYARPCRVYTYAQLQESRFCLQLVNHKGTHCSHVVECKHSHEPQYRLRISTVQQIPGDTSKLYYTPHTPQCTTT